MKMWPGWLVVLAGACGGGVNAHSTSTTSNPTTASLATSNPANTVATNASNAANASVVRVVDGDTIDVTIGGHHERVRLIGVDTPETVKPNTPVQCWGPQASSFTKHTLPPGTAVELVRDAEARDDYGRLLAYVYRSRDGLFVNLELARLGFARPLTIAPNDTFSAQFVAAATAAEAADLGLWAVCNR